MDDDLFGGIDDSVLLAAVAEAEKKLNGQDARTRPPAPEPSIYPLHPPPSSSTQNGTQTSFLPALARKPPTAPEWGGRSLAAPILRLDQGRHDFISHPSREEQGEVESHQWRQAQQWQGQQPSHSAWHAPGYGGRGVQGGGRRRRRRRGRRRRRRRGR
ncbi:hypothetical protein Naga_100702g1 [Nannochloropsis gaditana]|uniref:Uncharacterized protein n=1 Tax=Nannochloropsis gaditana TaxID=72520 RepID=W7TQB1_9STRA|nr:hypothetical protein Naga_100702g1 [Nannochloropsis gaditana]